MPYLGSTPNASFSSRTKQDFTANGSTTAFTLSSAVASANDIEVFVGNVRQEPTDAYTVNGTTLTMSAAPSNGINFYVIFKGVEENSVVPADNTISTAKIANNAVTVGKLATSGTLPALNGSAITHTGGLKSVQVFTSSGTYTKPSGITKLKVTCTGGGGSGGEGKGTYNYNGGGAAGGTAIDIIDASGISTVTVTVGSGGATVTAGNGSAGNAGSSSSFGSYCSATGGEGGKQEGGGQPRAQPGVGSGGVINIAGGQGQSQGGGNTVDEARGAIGGASFWGGGGTGSAGGRDDQAGLHGEAGRAYGSGGGGGGHSGSGNVFGNGGAGKIGIIYIEEYA